MTTPGLPSEAEPFVPRAGVRATIRVTGGQSGGAYSVVEWEREPATPGPLLHVHDGEEEAFLVLRGQLLVTAGDDQIELLPGGYAMIKRGTPHTYVPVGDDSTRFLIILSPPGYEAFFRELGEASENGAISVTAEIMATVGARHRMRVVGR